MDCTQHVALVGLSPRPAARISQFSSILGNSTKNFRRLQWLCVYELLPNNNLAGKVKRPSVMQIGRLNRTGGGVNIGRGYGYATAAAICLQTQARNTMQDRKQKAKTKFGFTHAQNISELRNAIFAESARRAPVTRLWAGLVAGQHVHTPNNAH